MKLIQIEELIINILVTGWLSQTLFMFSYVFDSKNDFFPKCTNCSDFILI